jgi:hypothetical protein
MSKGKMFLLGLLVLASVGSLYAQSVSSDFNFGSGFNLTPLQAQGGYPGYDEDSIRRSAMDSPMIAGMKNMLGGWYSWQNNDIFGGAMTAGLEGGGLILTIIGFVRFGSVNVFEDTSPLVMVGIGTGAMVGGMLFGYIKGSMLHKKLHAQTASANPIDHIDVIPVPTSDGGLGLSLAYSVKF